MKSKQKAGVVVAMGAFFSGVLFLHGVGSAQQAAPATSLLYSGYLEEAGAPVDGEKPIGLSLWNATTTSNESDRVCEQPATATTVAAGWFALGLASDCLDALRTFPNLHLQFTVAGVDFPLQPIGTVPYALRTLDSGSGTRLRRVLIQGDDGSSHAHPTRFWDSARDEECSFRKQGQLLMCAPAIPSSGGPSGCTSGSIVAGWYTDATCQTPAAVPAGSVASGTPLTYLSSGTATSGLAAVSGTTTAHWGCGTCNAGSQTVYLKGADIAASEFVAGSESHD